ncbi:aminopeptidase P family protein [Hoyosella rhizosphaerae]|uniref:Dipeptidase PepE n=1 Tax=Hoyosella rhizosphaerae TaxID=1755582 RepID=A0A916TZP7_9ACTN|nr:Xaa-Pro peptidase family protein [Hoyosella rhizosphaerae]MBN4927073.1 aminopeptidase P family protein [Hoyosella rhizosphaerae]GGC54270.1 putative dipeptidase PepE [Hoyosella rhizosphaerae]
MFEDVKAPTSEAFEAYKARLTAVSRRAAEEGVDALLITPGPDLQYLTGSTMTSFERLTCLIIPAHGMPTMVVPRLEVAALRGCILHSPAVVLAPWVDGDDPYLLIGRSVGRSARVAVSESTQALHLIPLMQHFDPPVRLATDVLREIRMIKDDAEIAALRAAGAAIDRVHARMGEFLQVGRTEADVAADITAAIIAEGHTRAAFVIVGSGPHGADPHHEVSDRVIEPGDIVVIDIGGPVPEGYFSDCTRTYSMGEPPADAAEKIALLEEAQRRAVELIRPGVAAGDVDAAARNYLAEHGLSEYFVHRTGHGIGLSVHEEPYILAGNNQTLRAGMAFSVEPGVYLQGKWGARIEDIVVVTESGCEPMNRQPHGLTVLPIAG